MVLEERARLEQSIIPAGHGLVMTRLRAAYSPAGQLSERLGGVTSLNAVRALSERVQSDWPSVRADLEILRGLVLNRPGMILNLTAPAELLTKANTSVKALIRSLPSAFAVPVSRTALPFPPAEALLVPAQVNYVGKACNIYDLG